MNQNILLAVFSSFILTSCFEKFDVNIDPNEQRVAIEAIISPAHQCLVRLTRTGGYLPNYNLGNFHENIKTIPDALVILSDDTGQTDTAIMMTYPEEGDTATWIKYKRLYPYIYYNWETNSYDTSLGYNSFVWEPGNFSGYYSTTKFRAIAGRSYHLYVQSEGKDYSADAYMPDVPEIDSGSIINKVSPLDGDVYGVPRISFHEAQDRKNYYMLSLRRDFEWQLDESKTPNNIFINILSDEFLPEYVYNLSVFSESDRNNALSFNEECVVFMYSLEKPAYQYLKCLLDQIRSDGGIYSAAPANLPTNFTGGALGFFIATDGSVIAIKPE